MMFELFALLFGSAVGFLALFIALVSRLDDKKEVGLSEITAGIFTMIMLFTVAPASAVVTVQGVNYALDWAMWLFGGLGVMVAVMTFMLLLDFVMAMIHDAEKKRGGAAEE